MVAISRELSSLSHPKSFLAVTDCASRRLIFSKRTASTTRPPLSSSAGKNSRCSDRFAGFFGLQRRSALRHDKELRQWIHHTTLDGKTEGRHGEQLATGNRL